MSSIVGSTSTARAPSQPIKSRANFCFKCPDITTLIVQEITGGTFLCRRDLVAFACICRSTVDPALRALWRAQVGLDKLIRTLPADSWKREWVGRVEQVFGENNRNEDIGEEVVTRAHLMQKKKQVFVSSWTFTTVTTICWT